MSLTPKQEAILIELDANGVFNPMTRQSFTDFHAGTFRGLERQGYAGCAWFAPGYRDEAPKRLWQITLYWITFKGQRALMEP